MVDRSCFDAFVRVHSLQRVLEFVVADCSGMDV